MRLRLIATGLFAAASIPGAQSFPADSIVRQPCVAPAPADSLCAQPATPTVWEVNGDGMLALEIEAHPPTGDWVFETVSEGYSGDGYYRWNGPDLFGTPGLGILRYPFHVNEPGSYSLILRNTHDNPDATLENDCWFRMDGGQWHKLFSNGAFSVGNWTWESTLEGPALNWWFNPGDHVMEFSGRSFGFKMDRVHLYRDGTAFAQSLQQKIAEPELSKPVLGGTMLVHMDDPTNSAALTPGLTVAFWVTGLAFPTYPCGAPIPGFGAFGGPGELMIDLPGGFLLAPPAVWAGPGNPVSFALDIPTNPSLIGVGVPTQGLFIDTSAAPNSPLVLTEGLELVVGQF